MEISNIAASLRYGNVITKKWLNAMYVVLVFFCLVFLFCIFVDIITVQFWSADVIFVLIIINFFPLLLIALFVYIIIKDKKLKARLLPLLEDAVKLKAYSKLVDKRYIGRFQPEYYRIEVSFVFASTKQKRISGDGDHMMAII
ncbi:MAG: hypothetical protein LBS99_05220 [Clostridiales bacterium]|nr:hypothetical protein [Clostridiales bacterium]